MSRAWCKRLHISNGDTIRTKLAAKDGKVEALAASSQPLYRIIEDCIYRSSRYPNDEEVVQLLAATNSAKKSVAESRSRICSGPF